MKPTRLLVVGSVLVDIRLNVAALPPRGGDQFATGTTLEAGGGFNVLAAATRNGLAAALVGRYGNGPFGTQVREDLNRAGIPVLLPPSSSGDTGFSMTLIEPDGERTFVTSPGAESALTPSLLANVDVRPDDAVYISGYDLCYPETGPAFEGWLPRLPREALLVFDPGPLVAQIPDSPLAATLARTDILTLNEREAGLLGGRAPVTVLRRGAEGAVLVANGATLTVPAPTVAAVDTTGAGDAHTGILVAALGAGYAIAEAVRRATAGAALAVTRYGSATAPTAAEIDGFLGCQS